MVVHSVLPDRLMAVVDAVLEEAGVEHVPHEDHMRAAQAAAEYGTALIGPYRSRAVAEAAEVTTPAGVPTAASRSSLEPLASARSSVETTSP